MSPEMGIFFYFKKYFYLVVDIIEKFLYIRLHEVEHQSQNNLQASQDHIRNMSQYSRELGQQEYNLGIFPNWVKPETKEEYVERIKNRHEEQQLALSEAMQQIDVLTSGTVLTSCEMPQEKSEATLSDYTLTISHSHTKTWRKRGVGMVTQSFAHQKTYKNANLQYFLSHLKEKLYEFLQEAQNSDLAYKILG